MRKIMALVLAPVLLAIAPAMAEADHLARIQEKGVLMVATEGNWAPWTYHDESDDDGDDDADDLDSLEPGLAAPADGLEHAPESVGEMEPESSEPHEVDDKHPPVAEESCKEVIRVVHIQLRGYLEKLRHLHVSPELCEMECDHTQDDKSEDEHILGRPGIGRSLAGHLITLVTAAGAHVLESKPDAIEDMDDETEGEDRDHNADHRSAHEVAAELEKADAIVIATPVYWYSYPAQLKSLMDHWYSLCYAGKSFAGKKAALIACCEDDSMEAFSGMTMSFRTSMELLEAEVVGEVLIQNVHKLGDIDRTDGLARAAGLASLF